MPEENEDPRIEMEVTITFRYKTDPGNYELSGPAENMAEEMAIMDREEFEDDPSLLVETMESEDLTITVKPVTEE